MLENLIQTLSEDRADLLRMELNLLHRSAERFFPEPEDKALADVSDFQGVGGHYDQNHQPVERLPIPSKANGGVSAEFVPSRCDTPQDTGMVPR
jgi:hypothetical protein